MGGEAHFRSVLQCEAVRQVLLRQGLDKTEIYGMGAYRESRVFNGGLKIWKEAWTVPLPARGVEGVNVHFESRLPGEIQIDVEVFPYEGSIAKDSKRLAELLPLVELKTELIVTIRLAATTRPKWQEDLGATTKGLRDPEASSTVCAVKFKRRFGTDPSVDSDAQFIPRVIDQVCPVVDEIIRDVRRRR